MDDTPSSNPSKWDDLQIRLISAAVMLVIGLLAIWIGGVWFKMLVVFATGLMIWELARMCAPEQEDKAVVLAVLAATTCSAQGQMGGVPQLSLFLAVPVLGAVLLKQRQVLFAIYAFAIGIATFSLNEFRSEFGAVWILWLMLVIVASDTLGYLAGRTFGGPKFWPKISPKKTWSGTIAGWFGAAVVGLVFMLTTKATLVLVLVSVIVAFAGQMGDIAESALKRKVGIKDSSDLIPGHGGLLDRFDAMLGAVLILAVLIYLFGLSGVAF